MHVNEMAQLCYETAATKGWHSPEMDMKRKPLEFHMLMVSELAEATEEVRNNKPPMYFVEAEGREKEVNPEDPNVQVMIQKGLKPEGEAVEIADVVIRAMDYFVMRGWNLEAVMRAKLAYNATRLPLHGGKSL